MKKVSLGITALALLVGFASAFASKTTRAAGTFWTTVVNHSVVNTAKVIATCKGTGTICAIQYTALGTRTGKVAFKTKPVN